MEIRKIVVGVDFSQEAEIALKRAMDIARHTGAELVLLHAGIVHEPLDENTVSSPQLAVYEEILAQTLRDDRLKVEELRSRYAGQGVEISHMVVSGFADTSICEAAQEIGASMICVGTHGRTGFRRFLLGSIAERVVRLSHVPVLVARGGGRPIGGFHRILVPTDFSYSAERALETAIQLASPGATIDVLHCWTLPPLADAYAMPVSVRDAAIGPLVDSIQQEARERGARLIERYRDRWPSLSFDVVRGSPAHAIVERAAGYDLIATGSHGRRGVRRFLLGSVAEVTVRHAPCSVLVVHSEPH
jgi:nucleotide-binding universal stress UspA family protein